MQDIYTYQVPDSVTLSKKDGFVVLPKEVGFVVLPKKDGFVVLPNNGCVKPF